MKILVTGATGQVGFELVRTLCVFGVVLAPTRDELDLADEQAVTRYLQQHQPQLIANAAAFTQVDHAEAAPEIADRLNHLLPKQLAHYCLNSRASLIHFSSDYVYSGAGDEPYSETSEVGPLSEYGRSKWAGDRAIIGSHCNYVIFRTSWVYSARGNNFMKTMLRLAQEKESLSIVDDQFGAPTSARLIAQIASMFVPKLLRHELSGTYHLATKGETNWLEFARAIFEYMAEIGLKLKLDSITPVSTENYSTDARRPLNSRLNTAKLSSDLDIELPDWQVVLKHTLMEYFDAR